MERPGHLIQRLRVARGLSQAEAGRRGGVPRTTWSTVESGDSANPHPDTKLRIARALDVRPSSIWPPRPRPLHLEEVDDPRWGPAVRAMAQRLDLSGSLVERQRFARRLVAVLDCVDSGASGPGRDGARWDELWQLANSLMFDPDRTPIAIVDGKLVERELDGFTPATRVRVIATRRRRLRGAGAVAEADGCR
jgi:transcriptional regulator with XRE-family HTH domain